MRGADDDYDGHNVNFCLSRSLAIYAVKCKFLDGQLSRIWCKSKNLLNPRRLASFDCHG
jgi:hypothetical protein